MVGIPPASASGATSGAGAGATVTATARRQLLAIATLVSLLAATVVVGSGGLAGLVVPGEGPRSTPEGTPPVSDQLRAVHASGVIGENVTVGVVDATGFDTDHRALVGRVGAARSFADGEGVANGGANAHGTATAAVVARTAPAAELHLASFDTGDEFVAAVNWLVGRDVDVVVAPVGFYGKRGDGRSRVARAAAAAARNDVVFVAPAGNLGRSHWRGSFDPDEGGVHQFGGGPRNYLLGDGERLSLWLSWPAGPPNGSYALELYRTNGSGSRLVARSQPFAGDETPNERIVADVDPDGTYYVRVTGPADAAGTPLAVSSPTHSLQYRRRARSVVAPATAEPVVAVGAYDRQRDRVAPYSSAGPVADGRPGVDVVAPGNHTVVGRDGRFVGSSASAAHVAGVAALVLSVEPALSPPTVEAVLRTTARDVGRPGVDTRSGTGLVRPRRAVQRARNATQS